ncbi:MAG: SurA N-terminal domain-containing protein [Gammaproteobacteria bacterium]
MLQTIRDRAQGWFATVVIAIIIVPFALWGIQQYIEAAANVVVAEVDGAELDLKQYDQAYEQYRRQLQAATGGQIDFSKIDQDVLKTAVVKQMVQEELLRQAATRANMRIGDEQVRAFIRAFEPFQRDGAFARDLYEQLLAREGLRPAGFEARMREEMLGDQLRQGVTGSVFVTDSEMRAIERLERQRRDLRYIVIPAEPAKGGVTVSDEDIRKEYDAHPDKYSTAEQVRVSYLEVGIDGLAAAVNVTDDELRHYFETNSANYSVAEQRSARQAVVRVEADAPVAQVDAALKKAQELVQAARDGKPLQDLVKEIPADAEPAVEFAETGFIQRGTMPGAFDNVLFALEPGTVGEPVRTEFGYHVIQLVEVKPGSARGFDDARADVERDYRREQAEKQLPEIAARLDSLAFEHRDSLEPAARELGMSPVDGGYIDRKGGQGVLGERAVIDAAFSPEVAQEGNNSQLIEIGTDRVVVLRALDHRPVQRKPLPEVQETIRAALVADRARDATRQRGQQLVGRLESGESADALASAEALQWQEARGVDRNNPDVPRAVIRAAFKLPRPQGKPIYGSVALGTGDFALIELTAVDDVEPPALSDPEMRARRQMLEQARTAGEWRSFLTALERGAKVRTHIDQL